MVCHGIVEPAALPWVFNIVLVNSKEGRRIASVLCRLPKTQRRNEAGYVSTAAD